LRSLLAAHCITLPAFMSVDAQIQHAYGPRGTSRSNLRVVMFEASFTGLVSLGSMLEHVHAAERAAFITMSPVDRERAAALRDALAQQPKLRWRSAEDGMLLESATVYIVPCDKTAHVHGDTLQLRDLVAEERATPVDTLLRSLAKLGERCIALLLSGRGSDGSLGVKALSARGGCVLAEDPRTAAEPELPRAVRAVIAPDHVAGPSELGQRLDQLLRADTVAAEARSDEASPHVLGALLSVLSEASGHDFTAYKRSLVWRRLRARMQLLELDTPQAYLALLQERRSEAQTFWGEFLIGVTGFFRDAEAYTRLERAIEHYITRSARSKHAAGARDLRIWVPACSTGEEAYSIAIVAQETLERAQLQASIQIFGTDLDAAAIQVARAGLYPLTARAAIGSARLSRYFVERDNALQVSQELRDLIVFAPHDVTRDPPFTRLDVLTCRNLLIFLEPELQQKLLALFHYALVPDGLLFLGSAESLGPLDDAFVAVDDKWKIFSNRAGQRPAHSIHSVRSAAPHEASREEAGEHAPTGAAESPAVLGRLADRLLLENLVPASALIDQRGEILHIHGRTGRFLELPAGTPTPNLFVLAREGLRLELPAAVREAVCQRRVVYRRDLHVKTHAGTEPVHLCVKPVVEAGQSSNLLLVTFEAGTDVTDPGRHSAAASVDAPDASGTSTSSHHQLARPAQLQRELQHVREQLQRCREALTAAERGERAAREKLQSMQQLLYGHSDELETSRQELQSMNEELQTLNAELQDRNAELSLLRDDVHNLLHSTALAALFLDAELNIKRFTAEAAQLFRVRDCDIGRPIDEMASSLRYPSLREDARQVLSTLAFCEREVQTTEGAWQLMRIVPYRTTHNVIAGLVITFKNIDPLKHAKQRAEQLRALGERILAALPNGVLALDEQLAELGRYLLLGADAALYDPISAVRARPAG